MEKISRIVGGNKRVAAVDLKNSAPVRPGTPSFGRPIGTSTQVDYDPRTTAQKAVELLNERDQKRAVQDRDTQIVQKMADAFFAQKARFLEQPHSQPTQEFSEVAAGEGASNEAEAPISTEEPTEAPKQFTPRGSYVDVRA